MEKKDLKWWSELRNNEIKGKYKNLKAYVEHLYGAVEALETELVWMKCKKKEEIQKEKIYRKIIEDILWMALRYGHGRHTYVPSILRDVVKQLKQIEPNFKLKKDITIKPPTKKELKSRGWIIREDWLDDLFEEK